MYKWFVILYGAAVVSCGAFAQDGVMADIMSGKLVNPSVGVWAWYEVKDTASGDRLFLRQAVVGDAKVEGKNGFWVETEVVPRIGYPVIYKMLLTGPANEPKNIHKVIFREGSNEPKEIEVDPSAAPAGGLGSTDRKSLGTEKIETPQGSVEAEHVVAEQDGKKTEVWTSDKVPPMGIIKLVSPVGELALQRYGKGGPDGESAMDKKIDAPSPNGDTKVTVKVNGGESRDVPQGQPKAESGTAKDAAPAKAKAGAAAPKKDFSKKKDGQ